MANTLEGGKRAEATRRKRYGVEHRSKLAYLGGKVRTRGYFGRLKDEGRTEEIKAISKKALKARWEDHEADRTPTQD